MRYRFLTATILASLGTLPAATAFADEGEAPEPASGITISARDVSAEVTLDYVSQYFFRGVEQLDSDQGAVFQPGASATIGVEDNVGLTIGTWGSIHTDTNGPPAPGASSNPTSWYEQDIYGSIDVDLGQINASVGLTYYSYPSANGGDVWELNLGLSHDAAELTDHVSLSFYAMLAIELQNNAFPDENTYLELGSEFEYSMQETADIPVTLTMPITLGLSIDDYYNERLGAADNEVFGFLSVGFFGEVAISDLLGYEEWFGAWNLRAGVTVYFLNSTVAMTDDASGSSNNIQYVATVGISREW